MDVFGVWGILELEEGWRLEAFVSEQSPLGSIRLI
jgi:hypothetical protein